MYIKFVLILFLLGWMTIHAQFKISGTITDEFEQHLSDVHIQIQSGNEFFSDSNGEFSIKNLKSDSYKLRFELVGYLPKDTLVQLSSDLNLNIRLKEQIHYLDVVKIEHSVSHTEKTIPVHTLNESILEKNSLKSLGDVLQEIEGVSTLKTGNSIVKPIINGVHSSRVPVIVNNLKLEDQEWGAEHAPNIDINSATSIQVIKGANALQYSGDAVGGIVLIQTDQPIKKDTIFGKTLVNFNSNGRGGSVSNSITNSFKSGWFWDLTLTGKYLGDVKAPDYNLSNTGNREQNAFFQTGYKSLNKGIWFTYSMFNSQTGILKASHIGSLTDLVNAINLQEPDYIADFTYNLDHPKQEVQHHLAKINAFYRFSDIGKLNFQYGFQFNNRKEFDIRRGTYVNTPALNLDLITHTAQLDFESVKFNSWKLKTGVQSMFQINEPNPMTNVRPLIPDYERIDVGFYAISEFNPNPRWNLNLGARYDFSRLDAKKYYLKSRWEERGYDEEFPEFVMGDFDNQILVNPVYQFHNISSSLGINYHPHHDYDLYFNASYTMRNPNPAELFSDGLHHSIATIELGDLSLEQEKAMKFSFTAQYQSDRFKWDISPYLNYIRDFMYLIPEGLEYTIRGAFPVWSYKQTDVLIWGVDAAAEWNYTRNLSHKITAAYLYGQDMENDLPLVDMPPFNFSNSITYRLENWNNLELTLKNQSFLTQNRYPDYNFYTDLNINGEQVSTEVDISTPPKGYSLFDFYAGFDLGSAMNREKSNIQIGFFIENIFNTSYRNYLNHQRFYSDEIGRNFNIQLKINY